jgi:predicted TIM-barrel fold metal-dependent hydrolase
MFVVDSHVHVFDPARFPYAPRTIYRPQQHETAPIEQLIAVLDAHRVSHAVVVTPMAGYHSDNRVTTDALARYPDRLRGIAVVEADVRTSDLENLRFKGVAGVRVDLIGRGTGFLLDEGRRLPGMLGDLGLILQIQCEGDQLAAIADVLRRQAGKIVIDHMGRPDVHRGLSQDGFRALLGLASRSDIFIKLSGPFRFDQGQWPYDVVMPYVASILTAFGADRCIWGSDWPFVRMDRRIDYGPALALVERWLTDPRDREKVLWETPARLFNLNGAA